MLVVVNLVFAGWLYAQPNKNPTDSLFYGKQLLKDSLSRQIYPGILRMVPKDFTTRNLPFFCRKELQVQKATGLAIKLRLGSVEYVDKLEGKH